MDRAKHLADIFATSESATEALQLPISHVGGVQQAMIAVQAPMPPAPPRIPPGDAYLPAEAVRQMAPNASTHSCARSRCEHELVAKSAGAFRCRSLRFIHSLIVASPTGR